MPDRRWAAVLAVLLAGCANLPMGEGFTWVGSTAGSGNVHLDYWMAARASRGGERELLWQRARGSAPRNAAAGELRLALLQSLDGHSGSDIPAAERRLRGLLARSPDAAVTAIARLRLAELQESRHWRRQAESSDQELAELKARLARLVDIERRSSRP